MPSSQSVPPQLGDPSLRSSRRPSGVHSSPGIPVDGTSTPRPATGTTVENRSRSQGLSGPPLSAGVAFWPPKLPFECSKPGSTSRSARHLVSVCQCWTTWCLLAGGGTLLNHRKLFSTLDTKISPNPSPRFVAPLRFTLSHSNHISH